MTRKRLLTAIAVGVVALGALYVFSGRSIAPSTEEQYQSNTSMNQESDLKIEDVKTGTGPAAKVGDTVVVHYTGTFADGKKFDSSYDRGEPFSFRLGAGTVIAGWDEGVAGMQPGGVRKLVIPPELGYGPSDYGPIPGNSTLYFTIELIAIR